MVLLEWDKGSRDVNHGCCNQSRDQQTSCSRSNALHCGFPPLHMLTPAIAAVVSMLWSAGLMGMIWHIY
jgi:hypothetical protein